MDDLARSLTVREWKRRDDLIPDDGRLPDYWQELFCWPGTVRGQVFTYYKARTFGGPVLEYITLHDETPSACLTRDGVTKTWIGGLETVWEVL